MSVQDSQLVGRESELAAVLRALECPGGGQPALVEVAGEPGIGKTRLLGSWRAVSLGHLQDESVIAGGHVRRRLCELPDSNACWTVARCSFATSRRYASCRSMTVTIVAQESLPEPQRGRSGGS